MSVRLYDFQERLSWSDGASPGAAICNVLLDRIPGAFEVIRANKRDDKNGTDYWVRREGGLPDLSVDCKVRDHDPVPRYGSDGVAMETWSVVEQRVPGWTRDPRKRTDFVLWFWIDSGRFCLVAFPGLCWVFVRQWQQWRKEFRRAVQGTKNETGHVLWHSECVFVPRRRLFDEILKWSNGAEVA